MNKKEATKKSNRRYYLKHTEKVLSLNRAYRNDHLEQIKAYDKRYAQDPMHREQARIRAHKCYLKYKTERMVKQREGNRILKTDILTYYGGGNLACVDCGEKRLACLSLDHINNDGASHRRKLGREGAAFYRWVVKEGYPSGYQTLCMNCQWVKQEGVYKSKYTR